MPETDDIQRLLPGGQTPFDVLGVSPNATSRELRNAMEEQLEEIDFTKGSQEEKLRKRRRIEEAYEAVREPKSRLSEELLVYDPSVGRRECKEAAERLRDVEFDVGRVLKGAAEVFPESPELDASDVPTEAPGLDQSMWLVDATESLRPGPKDEAFAAIRFDT